MPKYIQYLLRGACHLALCSLSNIYRITCLCPVSLTSKQYGNQIMHQTRRKHATRTLKSPSFHWRIPWQLLMPSSTLMQEPAIHRGHRNFVIVSHSTSARPCFGQGKPPGHAINSCITSAIHALGYRKWWQVIYSQVKLEVISIILCTRFILTHTNPSSLAS